MRRPTLDRVCGNVGEPPPQPSGGSVSPLLILALTLAGCASSPEATTNAKRDATAGPAFDIVQLDETPTPVFQARPHYPENYAKSRTTGSALVDFVVDANGDVVGARVLRATHPEFGEAAVAAVQRWKFKPGRKGGKPVATHMQVPLIFEMDAPPIPGLVNPARELGTTPVVLESIDISKLDQVPVPRFQARPHYPAHLREKRVRGEAVIDFIVDVNGDVRNAKVVRATHPEFGEAALVAVVQWKFKPGSLKGGVVNTHMQVPIVFALN